MEAENQPNLNQINVDLSNLNLKEKQTTSTLSPSEVYIKENQRKYIQLHEDESASLEITQQLLNLTNELNLGQMVHTEDFTLEETMNSVELDHFKMDLHYNSNKARTFKRLHREGKVKAIEELDLAETLSLIDNLFIRELMWFYGHPIYQTVFSLVYFSDNQTLSQNVSSPSIFRSYLDSSLHMLYLTFSSVVDCSCLREEDVMMIPIQNVAVLKRENVLEKLRAIEKDLKGKLKEENENKKLLNSLLMRIKLRIYFFSVMKEQFDFSNKKRFSNLSTLAGTIKNILNEMRNDFPSAEELKLTEAYFCEHLCRITPPISSIKIINLFTYQQAFEKMELITDNLTAMSRIYDSNNSTDPSQLCKAFENINCQLPSFVIRSMLELNLFPKGESKLFYSLDFKAHLFKTLTVDLKAQCPGENSDFMTNFFNLQKELMINSLRNRTRQVRDSAALFEGLAYLVFEANQLDKEMKKSNTKSKTPPLPTLTNITLRDLIREMLSHVWISFELNLFAAFELDYVFYLTGTLTEQLCGNINIIARSFAEKTLREDDMAKSTSKKKMSPIQKTILDEVYIFNGLRCAVKGLALTCRYMKVAGIIPSVMTEEKMKLNTGNRFPSFKNCKFFVDMSYESFVRETKFDVEKEKDLILQSADSYLKQAVKYLNEIKAADLKLRDAFHYPNTFIESLSKSIISNNLFLSKVKKLDKKGVKVQYSRKYESFFPVLELVNNI